MEPYYTIMRVPSERREEFVLLMLCNPARRDNMIAWMAARSDPPEHGRLIVYKLPKQRLYLAATAEGALPELRRVIVAHGNEIAMEPTLEQALAVIFQSESSGPPRLPDPRAAGERAPGPAMALPALGRRALEIWISAQDALRRGDLEQDATASKEEHLPTPRTGGSRK